MTSKIIREDGTTQLSNIKSVTYTETVNAGDGLKPGCVGSASIEVEVYGSQSSAPSGGEELTYYQVDTEGNETLIGVFYAEPSIPSRNTYTFIAYDAISKLDKLYSERLNEIQLDFPMTVYELVSDACTFAGVALGSSSWAFSTQSVQAFYADGLTCRSILQYAAEIAGKFVRCNTSGEVIFDWYTTNSSYSVHPGATQSSYRAYKQDGLEYDNYVVSLVDAVAVRPIGTDGAAYIYPQTAISIVVDDPNSDGNIVIQNIIVSDDGNGNLYLGANASDTNANGNITVSDTATEVVNPFTVEGNLLLNNASSSTYLAVAQHLYEVMSALPTYRHSTINLFVNENPFRAGEFVNVTDIQGVTFLTPVFEMTVRPSGATLRSSGARTYAINTGSSVSKALANLSANIVEIEKLKVDWADIGTAIIDTLEATGINADWITSGSFTSTGEYGYQSQEIVIGNGCITMLGAIITSFFRARYFPWPNERSYSGHCLQIKLPIEHENYVTGFEILATGSAIPTIIEFDMYGDSSSATERMDVYVTPYFSKNINVGNSAESKSRSLDADDIDKWNDLYFEDGDTLTISNYYPLSAYVTSSTTSLRIGVPVGKSMANINTVSVTSLVGGCRGTSGYLNSLSGDNNNYATLGTVSAAKASDNLVIITLNATNAFTNVYNNTPLTFAANDITLSFTNT